MPAAKTRRPALPATRRITRQTTRLFWAQLVELPVEISRWVVTLAAEDNLAHNARWVAQSLSVVCRAFHDVVDPILVRSVRFTYSNKRKLDGLRKDRFARTIHVETNPVSTWPLKEYISFSFPSATHFEGNLLQLWELSQDALFRPQYVTARGSVYPPHGPTRIQPLAHITHLHLPEHINISPHVLQDLLPGIKRLVVDRFTTSDVLETLEPFLRGPLCSLERLIVRSPFQLDRLQVQEFAEAKRDKRIWFALYGYLPGELDESDGTVWNSGSQLFCN